MELKSRKEKEAEKMEVVDSFLYPWDRNPSENDKSYRLFLAFKDMGRTRSYVAVLDLFPQLNYPAIAQLGLRYKWFDRAAAYDEHQDEKFRMKLDEEVLHAKIRQQKLGSMMSDLAEKGLKMLEEFPEELSPAEISKFAEIGTKIENLALGSSTEIKEAKIDAKIGIEVEKIDPEIAKEVGKLIAIKSSEKMIVAV